MAPGGRTKRVRERGMTQTGTEYVADNRTYIDKPLGDDLLAPQYEAHSNTIDDLEPANQHIEYHDGRDTRMAANQLKKEKAERTELNKRRKSNWK